MAGKFTISRISETRRGRPPVNVVTIDQSTSEVIPEGAVSLVELREAEIARADEARRAQKESGAFGFFIGESACTPQTDIASLTCGLEPGVAVYEPVPDQIDHNPVSSARI